MCFRHEELCDVLVKVHVYDKSCKDSFLHGLQLQLKNVNNPLYRLALYTTTVTMENKYVVFNQLHTYKVI